MKAIRLALLAAACSVPLLAAAQWQWVEKDGRKVFSDQPPPADVPQNRILKQPGARAPAAPPAAAEAITPQAGPATTSRGESAATAAASAPKVSGKDKELEAKKKAAEAAEAAKKKADEEKIAVARAENCTRAKNAKLSFDSGARITRTNAQGEREFLDDKQRATEVKRLGDIIARDCAK